MTRHAFDSPQFYLTSPQACPYLEDRQERKIFTYLVGAEARNLNDLLSVGGFRRSQTIAYRPACPDCKACKSVRVVVPQFQFSRNQRKLLKRNSDIVRIIKPASATSEQYALFHRYLRSRHDDGGMVEMSEADYIAMIEESHIETMVVEYRRRVEGHGITGSADGELLAVTLTDILDDATSMVYSFFSPEMERRSLGTYIILDHIRQAIELGLSYVYLGYWVKDSHKMSYKTRFKPLEVLGADGWICLD
ncbi:arginyltransferase [uncultured Cohaesibacter sp.]|uniref:arginyltransferase n=1 Tax=uncultured Cohaesibacter sp. TaxID=1002546 RepID=UPI0029C78EF4|nr:arginyltransferase [uncultured Cohaesibacter sp.]